MSSPVDDPTRTRVTRILPDAESTPVAAPVAVAAADDHRTRMLPEGAPAPTSLPSLRMLGPYRLLRVIGRGGMGAVWEAEDTRLGRRVAVKVALHGASPEAAERFRREATHAARLRHPHIVPVHDVGHDQGQWYLVMDLVRGVTLAEARRAGVLSYRRAAALLERVARAVAYAHGEGVVHRDLKPENIMLELASTGSSATNTQQQVALQALMPEAEPLVMDFGLAKDLTSASDLSQTGVALGTPAYMPPEQAEGRPEAVGRASDIYSLGAILYELITGRPPFTGENAMQVLTQVVNEDPLPPRRIVPAIPRDLETICLACLQKDPGRRYPSAGALADDLRAFQLGEPIHARRTSIAARIGRVLRRQRRTVLTVVLLLLVVAAAGALYVEHLQEQASWRLLAQDDLADDSWKTRWRIQVGAVERRGHQLVTTGTTASAIVWSKRLEGPVAIDYDAQWLPGALPGDLSFVWARDIRPPLPTEVRWPGMVHPIACQFGAMDGSYSAILVDDDEVDAHPLHPQPGVRHHVRVEIVDTRIRMLVDGAEVVHYEDVFPLTGGYACLFGFYRNKAFGPVRISALSMPQKVPATAVGDAFAENRDYHAAERAYVGVADTYPGTPLAQEARYKAGLCADRAGDPVRAETYWTQLAHTEYADRIAVNRLESLADRVLPERTDAPIRAAGVDHLLEGMTHAARHPDVRTRVAVLWVRCVNRAWDHGDHALLLRLLALHDAVLVDADGVDSTAAGALLVLHRYEDVLHQYPQLRWMCAAALAALGRYHECALRYPDMRGTLLQCSYNTGDFARCLAMEAEEGVGDGHILTDMNRPQETLAVPLLTDSDHAYALVALGRLGEAQAVGDATWWGCCARMLQGRPIPPPYSDWGRMGRGEYDALIATGGSAMITAWAQDCRLLVRLIDAPGDAAAQQALRHQQALFPQRVLGSDPFEIDQVTVLPAAQEVLGDHDACDRTIAAFTEETRWIQQQRLWHAAMRAAGRMETATFLAQPYQLAIRMEDELWQGIASERRGDRAAATTHFTRYLTARRWQRGPEFDPLRELYARWRLRCLGGAATLWSRPSMPDGAEPTASAAASTGASTAASRSTAPTAAPLQGTASPPATASAPAP